MEKKITTVPLKHLATDIKVNHAIECTDLTERVIEFNGQLGCHCDEKGYLECHCTDDLYFAMNDSLGQFGLGLRTILKCIHVAEKVGHLPPLPEGWWDSVMIRHDLTHDMPEDDFLLPAEKSS